MPRHSNFTHGGVGSLAEGMHSIPSQSGPPQGPQENVSKQGEVPLEQREAQRVTCEDD